MLALSRKVGETIVINDNIELTILDINRDQVKLGIVAPRSVPIHRKEIFLQIKEENENAAASSAKNAGKFSELMK